VAGGNLSTRPSTSEPALDTGLRTQGQHTVCIAHRSVKRAHTKHSAVRTVVPDRLSCHEAHVAAPGHHLRTSDSALVQVLGARAERTQGPASRPAAAGRARPRPCAEGDSARSSSAGYLNVLPSWNVTSRACGAKTGKRCQCACDKARQRYRHSSHGYLVLLQQVHADCVRRGAGRSAEPPAAQDGAQASYGRPEARCSHPQSLACPALIRVVSTGQVCHILTQARPCLPEPGLRQQAWLHSFSCSKLVILRLLFKWMCENG